MQYTWIQPKTDWVVTDRFNQEDYNRIKNNLNYLYKVVSDIFGGFTFIDMGEDHTDRRKRWDVDVFNAFEENLEQLALHSTKVNYGTKQSFYENGIFIKWDELNRVESACLDIYEQTEFIEVPKKRIPFRLGSPYFPVRI